MLGAVMPESEKKNGGLFIAGALTWANTTFVSLLDYMNFMMKCDIIENYENLKQLKGNVLFYLCLRSCD